MDDTKLIETCNSILENMKKLNIDEDNFPGLEIEDVPFMLFSDEGKTVTADYIRGYLACMNAIVEKKDAKELFFQKMQEYRETERKNKELLAKELAQFEKDPCNSCCTLDECPGTASCTRFLDYANSKD